MATINSLQAYAKSRGTASTEMLLNMDSAIRAIREDQSGTIIINSKHSAKNGTDQVLLLPAPILQLLHKNRNAGMIKASDGNY